MNKFVDFFFPKTPGDKRATKAFSIAAIVLVVVILLNVFVGTLSADKTQLDISGKGIYKISDVSMEVIENLEYDIELIMVYNGTPYDRVNKFVNKYAGLSDRITAKLVNPAQDTSVMTEYDCVSGDLVVSCPETGKYKTITMLGPDDALVLTTTNSYTGSTSATTMDADSQITSAIKQVTGSMSGTAYVMTGHGEFELPTGAADVIEKNSIAISETPINLLMSEGGIPEDCTTLICYAPTSDLADDELDIIRNYLQSGGHMTLVLNDYEQKNFNSLISEYGLEVQSGYAGDAKNYYYNYVNYYGYFCIAPELSTTSPITSDITEASLVLYPFGMKEVAPARDTISLDAFMTTTDSGLLLIDEESVEENVKLIMGATATEKVENGKTSSLTVFSAATLIDDSITESYPNMSNLDIFIKAVTSQLEVDAISIAPISLTNSLNTITNAGFIGILFMYVLPLMILVYGVIYCVRRKRR